MVSDLVSQNINIFLRNTVKVTGVVVFMFSLSWQLSLVTFMGFPIIMMVSDIYGKYYKVGPAWSLLGSVSTGSSERLLDPLGGAQGATRDHLGGDQGATTHLEAAFAFIHMSIHSVNTY